VPVKTEKRDEIHNQEDRFKFHGPKNKINGKVKKLIDSYFYWDKHPAKGFSYTEEMPSEPIFIFFFKKIYDVHFCSSSDFFEGKIEISTIKR